MLKNWFAGVLAVGAWFVTGEVLAAPGDGGTLVLGADRLFGVTSFTETNDDVDTEYTVTQVSLLAGSTPFVAVQAPRLSIDYFLDPGISLGGAIGYANYAISTESDGASAEDSVGVLIFAPRVGYATMFNEDVGLWPRLGITYASASMTVEDPISGDDFDQESSETWLDLELNLVITPATGVGLTAGLTFDSRLSESVATDGDDLDRGDTSMTGFGLQFGLLAYF